MFATAFFDDRHFSLKGKFKMPPIGEKAAGKFDTTIQLGSVLVAVQMLVFACIWFANDHASTSNNTAQNSVIMEKLDRISIELPLANRSIEVNGARITQLEQQYAEVRDRIAQLQQFEAITAQTLVELKQNYSDLVAASQTRAPVNRPHAR